MRILFLYEGYDEYTVQLWKNIKLKNPKARISLLTTKNAKTKYKERLALEEGERIYTEEDRSTYFPLSSLSVIRNMPRYDIIHITYMELKWGVLAYHLRRKCDRLIISVGGSDMYRTAAKLHKRILQLRLIKHADVISSENSQTREYFYKVYGKRTLRIPHHIVRYGVNVIDAIINLRDDVSSIKKKWNLPLGKTVIMLGHNGSRNHQHMGMIAALAGMDKSVKEKCFFLIPMTYLVPGKDYRELVENEIAEVTDDYRILDDFLNVDQMAEITIMTDIMIHVQTTDQLSSTMMAHLYNGNIVVAGSWLPYNDIKDAGIKLYDVNTVCDVGGVLTNIVNNISMYKDECSGNRERVYRFSSWECCADKWMEMYNEGSNV